MSSTINYYHRTRKKLIEALGGRCSKCGINENLEFHHINGDGLHGIGGWGQLYEVRDRIDDHSIILLCRECHKEAHINE